MDYKILSPGSHKLIHHLSHLTKIKDGEVVGPIHLSLWPNTICQCNCSYCCGRYVDKKGELTWEQFSKAINVLVKYGLKAVEFSGICGEPLLWKDINRAIEYLYNKNIKISIITNGYALENIETNNLNKISWIRVSLQSIDHAMSIKFSDIIKHTKITCSYIISNENDLTILQSLDKFSVDNDITIRIGAQRPCDDERIDEIKSYMINCKGNIFFSDKKSGAALGCYMPYVRAAIDWNGNFLPCPSIQLNYENEGKIPESYILCNIDTLEEWILNNPAHDLGYKCNFCNCGKENNDFVYNIIHGVEDVEFV